VPGGFSVKSARNRREGNVRPEGKLERDRYKISAAVFVVLLRSDEAFMIRRKATGWMDGLFSIAAGGLEAVETIREAARREASEEPGIGICPSALVCSRTLCTRTSTGDRIGQFFTSAKWDGEPNATEREKHDSCGRHALDDLPSSTVPSVRQALSNIAERVPYSEYGWLRDRAWSEGEIDDF
jgi:8-oxo-dGTP diphosphatase